MCVCIRCIFAAVLPEASIGTKRDPSTFALKGEIRGWFTRVFFQTFGAIWVVPFPVRVANEGLVRDPRANGMSSWWWHLRKGDNPSYHENYMPLKCLTSFRKALETWLPFGHSVFWILTSLLFDGNVHQISVSHEIWLAKHFLSNTKKQLQQCVHPKTFHAEGLRADYVVSTHPLCSIICEESICELVLICFPYPIDQCTVYLPSFTIRINYQCIAEKYLGRKIKQSSTFALGHLGTREHSPKMIQSIYVDMYITPKRSPPSKDIALTTTFDAHASTRDNESWADLELQRSVSQQKVRSKALQ